MNLEFLASYPLTNNVIMLKISGGVVKTVMIKIRAMGAQELKQVLDLLARFSEEDFEYKVLQNFRQLYGPIQRFSQILPPHLQFVPAIFVAVSGKKVLGLVWLNKDGKKSNRWKIEQLIIDPDEFSYDVGTQLINYVVNRYGAEGVQTFLALVHRDFDQGLGLLKSCGFRHVTRVSAYYHDNVAHLISENPKVTSITGLREAGHQDRFKLKSLHDDSLPTDKRIPLEKSPKDFTKGFIESVSDRLKGLFYKRWVVEDRVHGMFLATVSLSTENYHDFHMDISVSPAWESGYQDLLLFAIGQVRQQTEGAKIYIQAYKFHKEQMAVIEEMKFERLYDAELLVKDYWVPLSEKPDRKGSPVLLFAGKTSTACQQ